MHQNATPSPLLPHGMAAPNVKQPGSRGGKVYTTRNGTLRYGGPSDKSDVPVSTGRYANQSHVLKPTGGGKNEFLRKVGKSILTPQPMAAEDKLWLRDAKKLGKTYKTWLEKQAQEYGLVYHRKSNKEWVTKPA